MAVKVAYYNFHESIIEVVGRLAKKSEPAEPVEDKEEVTLPPAAPLRRPHSPRRNDDAGSDKGVKYPQQKSSPHQNNFNHGSRNFKRPAGDNRPTRDRSQGERSQENRSYSNKQDDKPQARSTNINKQNGDRPANKSFDKPMNRPLGQRPPLRHDNKDDTDNLETNDNKPTPAAPAPVPKPAEAPKPAPNEAEPPKPKVNGVRAPASRNDVTPVKKVVVPKNYLIELLSPGDTVLLSVESSASECRTKKSGYVCLSVHEKYELDYQKLCEDYTVHCEAENKECKPNLGESFSYLNPADGGWYRARLLTPTLAALVDSGKVVPISSSDKLKPLPAEYETPPEFCCLLDAPSVEVGQNLKCTLVSKTPDGFKVTLESVDTGAAAGAGLVARWAPDVDPPAPPAAPAQPLIPEVPRPDVTHNSSVLLVDATALERAFVRPSGAAAQRLYDAALEEAVLYGRSATPLKEPPQKGQVVIALFEGLHYRALCKRTNVKHNKYLLEYIEFGNVEVTTLENIYPCPPNLDLTAAPTQVSLVSLQTSCTAPLTPPAQQYLDKIKDGAVELNLTIPSGAATAASGSAVVLTVAKNNESVNRKLEEMCTPEWKKLEERGVDVVETKPLLYGDLECQELPPGGCALDVLDISALAEGSISACRQGTHNLDKLNEQMEAYCNSELGKEPYLPKYEELCIARFPPYPNWFRAVLLEQTPGAATARVCYVDYGNVAEVPVEMLRKMLPEFVRGLPALASHLEVKDFPADVTPDQLARAVEHMNINDEGRGVLTVTKCEKQEGGLYEVHAPELLRAMRG